MFKLFKQQGVNLLELIVVLAIIIILTTLSFPSFVTLIRSHRLKGVAESLYLDLQNARAEAVKRNSNVYVSFITGDTWCYGLNVGSACDCTVSSNCNLGTKSAPGSQLITLSMTGYSGNNIIFEGTHGAANASGTITLNVYLQTPLVTFSIGRLGNIQSCSTDISGYPAC